MDIMKKRISLILSVILLALVVIPVACVNATTTTDCQVSVETKMDGKTLQDNTRYEVEGGETVKVRSSSTKTSIEFITHYFVIIDPKTGDYTTTAHYKDRNLAKVGVNAQGNSIYESTFTIPYKPAGSLINLMVEPVASNDDGSENTITKTGWQKYTLEYKDKSTTGKKVEVTYGSKVLSTNSTTVVKAGEKLVIKATPTDKLSKLYYKWGDEAQKSTTYSTVNFTIASSTPAGTYKFVVNALYNDGLYADDRNERTTVDQVYYIKVSNDTTPVVGQKKLELTYDSKVLSTNSTTTVRPGDKLVIKATPNTELTTLYYKWGNDAQKTTTASTLNFTINSATVSGTYKFVINALYSDGLYADGRNANATVDQVYYIKVSNDTTPVVGEKKLELTYGSKVLKPNSTTTIKAGEKIVVKATPKADLTTLSYKWGNDPQKTTTASTLSFTIDSTTVAGTYKFVINALYNDGLYADGRNANNTVDQVYTFVIEKSGKPENNRELDIEPWMEENDSTENLSISLRNDSENDDKANRNIYALDEVVTYYIDYKNGDQKTDDVSIKLELPLDFKAVDLDGGKVGKDNIIEWVFENGLDEDEAGTIIVKIKYTDLKKSRDDANTIYPTAEIYKGSKVKDVSTVINFIIRDYDEEIDIEHEPFMYGDADSDTFRPDNIITRAEGALVLARIFGLDYTTIREKDITTKYTDISNTYFEAQQAITAASKAGLINGYLEADGTYTYRPNNRMTKAEFMKILACMIQENAKADKIDGLEIKDMESLVKVYDDATRYYIVDGKRVYTHWALEEITLLARLNMLPLTEKEPDFELDEKITRAEVAQLINFYLLRAPAEVTNRTKTGFSDVTRRHDLVGDIIEATRSAHTFSITKDATEVEE